MFWVLVEQGRKVTQRIICFILCNAPCNFHSSLLVYIYAEESTSTLAILPPPLTYLSLLHFLQIMCVKLCMLCIHVFTKRKVEVGQLAFTSYLSSTFPLLFVGNYYFLYWSHSVLFFALYLFTDSTHFFVPSTSAFFLVQSIISRFLDWAQSLTQEPNLKFSVMSRTKVKHYFKIDSVNFQFNASLSQSEFTFFLKDCILLSEEGGAGKTFVFYSWTKSVHVQSNFYSPQNLWWHERQPS